MFRKRRIDEPTARIEPESLITRADQLLDTGRELDLDSSLDPDPDYRTHKRSRASGLEEDRLLSLLGASEQSLREQILASKQPDLVRAKCLQYLKQYEDDPENNSTALSAVQLILQLPTSTVSPPVSRSNTHDEVCAFLDHAWEEMERHVYGQDRAKMEIIEYLVSKVLCRENTPRVLGLVGPPGVGKTTLAVHGVAEAMGLPFYHISIGGLRDVTYFTGSIRCWKGAHQGIFTDILIKKGCLNPVIYIDELDKVARDTAGDIYGVLTHATDPLTNKYIQDMFLGIDIDVSKATFIFSYNDPDMIPAPLRDRIKEINLTGFCPEEKVKIAKGHIIPGCLGEYGVKETDILFSDEIIRRINDGANGDGGDGRTSTRELSGVRSLKHAYQTLIGRIMVSVVGHRGSYDRLTGQAGGKTKVRPKRYKFAAALPSIALPYRVTLDDARSAESWQ